MVIGILYGQADGPGAILARGLLAPSPRVVLVLVNPRVSASHAAVRKEYAIDHAFPQAEPARILFRGFQTDPLPTYN